MNENKWELETYLTQLIGRKVTKVICCEPGYDINSPAQFIMEMDNDTTYELYGRDSLGISGLRHNTTGFCDAIYNAASQNKQAAAFADGKTVRCYEPGNSDK